MISGFTGEHKFLSNFYPCIVFYEGIEYPTSEHAFQAAKTEDVVVRKLLSQVKTPGEAKRFGRNLKLRPDWETIKLKKMEMVLIDKFTRNAELRTLLLKTGDQPLVETNHWGDKYWGICNGVGENHLGLTLMNVRTIIRERFAYEG